MGCCSQVVCTSLCSDRLTPVLLALMDSKSLAVKIAAGQAAAVLFELVPQDSDVRHTHTRTHTCMHRVDCM